MELIHLGLAYALTVELSYPLTAHPSLLFLWIFLCVPPRASFPHESAVDRMLKAAAEHRR